jgi:hypothetical protein
MTKNPAAVKFRSPQKDLLDLNPTDGSNRICYSAPRIPLSKAFDLIRADADSKISVGLNSKDGADLGLIASLDSPHNPAKSIPNFSSAFDSVCTTTTKYHCAYYSRKNNSPTKSSL